MLRELRVGNLALVDDLALPLDSGLTMLTGETGAGKSLIAGALLLLTGVKADLGLIREGEDLAWVEGVFELGERPRLAERIAGLGVRLAGDGVLVLRRELRREGRGRVLINGLVSSLAVLEQAGGALLSIQSQDQQRALGRPSFARDFLDNVLGLADERARVAGCLAELNRLSEDLRQRRQEEEFARQQLEMWEYQFRELQGMGLDVAEEEQLAEQLAFGRNARSLLEAADRARTDLTEGPVNARQLLGRAESGLAAVADNSQRITDILGLLQEASAAIADAGQELERFLDGAVVDPSQLDEMEERKAQYENLRRKYGRDVDGLLELQGELAERIDRQRAAGRSIEELTGEVAAARAALADAALDLRQKRVGGAAGVARQACALVRPLALPELELEFLVEPRPAGSDGVMVGGRACTVGSSGADAVRLLARTNRGEKQGEVARIASGGEKSRIYLGLSVLAGDRSDQPLLLFDEIDAGLGMDNAIPVAKLLAELARKGQVLCITHLATVAAHGGAHLKAAKTVSGGRTVLAVTALTEVERLPEIARLLGGELAGDAASADTRLAYAKQLLARG